jgi:hypothetical protein
VAAGHVVAVACDEQPKRCQPEHARGSEDGHDRTIMHRVGRRAEPVGGPRRVARRGALGQARARRRIADRIVDWRRPIRRSGPSASTSITSRKLPEGTAFPAAGYHEDGMPTSSLSWSGAVVVGFLAACGGRVGSTSATGDEQGSVVTIDAAQQWPFGIVVSGDALSWANQCSGTVAEVPVAGGAVSSLANTGNALRRSVLSSYRMGYSPGPQRHPA